ncbi:MAG: hypothetical protein A3D92_11425 [Bacteroidetes bacterium RIFCSPHIGHO2_02_FULL_44_7]|nr:MAG: hypothetical protein A3D92_11425 [Bacteroidetes bacterium RIFCSPHIGHO2_02_FULL_44_7]
MDKVDSFARSHLRNFDKKIPPSRTYRDQIIEYLKSCVIRKPYEHNGAARDIFLNEQEWCSRSYYKLG